LISKKCPVVGSSHSHGEVELADVGSRQSHSYWWCHHLLCSFGCGYISHNV